MLTISDAFERLLATVAPLAPVTLPLQECLGLTLAEDVVATLDSPPFDKALMDGYAVRSEDLVSGIKQFDVIEIVAAGMVPSMTVQKRQATQIMTGAPLPEGADIVVKVEESTRTDHKVRLETKSVMPGLNLVRKGTSVRSGAVVLQKGTTLNGSRIGALAELGRSHVQVYRRPTVGVLATGDELVPVDQAPGPGQIRNSNQAMLVAQVQAAGAIPVPLGIAKDNQEHLEIKIHEGLQCDVLVLSGGVSAGTFDLVPSELARADVEEVFHKVEMKPGKPIWFGRRSVPEITNYVFGLPGNPVSSLVCFELFVRTAIRQMMGEMSVMPQSIPARLEHDYSARADRPTYHPARLTWTNEGSVVTLVKWHGSSDLCGTVTANGMAVLSGEAKEFRAGDLIETIAW